MSGFGSARKGIARATKDSPGGDRRREIDRRSADPVRKRKQFAPGKRIRSAAFPDPDRRGTPGFHRQAGIFSRKRFARLSLPPAAMKLESVNRGHRPGHYPIAASRNPANVYRNRGKIRTGNLRNRYPVYRFFQAPERNRGNNPRSERHPGPRVRPGTYGREYRTGNAEADIRSVETSAKCELLVNFSAPRSTYLPVRLTAVLEIDFGFHHFAEVSVGDCASVAITMSMTVSCTVRIVTARNPKKTSYIEFEKSDVLDIMPPCTHSSVGLERSPPKAEAAGSSPAGCTKIIKTPGENAGRCGASRSPTVWTPAPGGPTGEPSWVHQNNQNPRRERGAMRSIEESNGLDSGPGRPNGRAQLGAPNIAIRQLVFLKRQFLCTNPGQLRRY